MESLESGSVADPGREGGGVGEKGGGLNYDLDFLQSIYFDSFNSHP